MTVLSPRQDLISLFLLSLFSLEGMLELLLYSVEEIVFDSIANTLSKRFYVGKLLR